MLSSKSSNVPWPIAIDDQKCQNFCLLCNSCPGWKIEPIGSEKVCMYVAMSILVVIAYEMNYINVAAK